MCIQAQHVLLCADTSVRVHHLNDLPGLLSCLKPAEGGCAGTEEPDIGGGGDDAHAGRLDSGSVTCGLT